MGESDDDVLGEVLMDLEELAVIHDAPDDLVHVIRSVRIIGDNLVKAVIRAAHGVVGWDPWCLLHIVLGNVGEQFLDSIDSLFLALSREMCHSALGSVYACSSKLLLGDVFSEDALDHCRTCQEHVGSVLDHDGEIRQGR